MDPRPTIALFARFPLAGEVKTRLIPALGADGAARLHRHLVERTLATMRTSGLPYSVHFTGASAQDFGRWLGPDLALVDQGAGDLGARLARVAAPAIVLGADVPDLSAEHLAAAARALDHVPVVIGPATDGGYYLLGFRQDAGFLWRDMPWGSDRVLAETEARLHQHSVPYRLLAPLADCDRPEDLANWPELLA